MTSLNIKTLYKTLGYAFNDEKLLLNALTHISASRKSSYERLEFLGDRILGAVIADLIYHHFPLEVEGSMAKRYTKLVCADTLSQIAASLKLDKHMIMAKGEQATGGRHKKSILADVCESIIAALYLDGGLEAASQFIIKHWSPLLTEMKTPPIDAKTELQEISQSMGKGIPIYTHLKTEGPDHAPLFTTQVELQGYPPQQAEGSSKRIAEQKAAHLLVTRIKESK